MLVVCLDTFELVIFIVILMFVFFKVGELLILSLVIVIMVFYYKMNGEGS